MKNGAKFMITYLCGSCGNDFAKTEQEKVICFGCGEEERHQFVKKEALTKEVLLARMKVNAARTLENLIKAYQVKPDGVDEKELLEAMEKAKQIKELTDKLE